MRTIMRRRPIFVLLVWAALAMAALAPTLTAQEAPASVERQAREALPSVVTQVDLERRLLEDDLGAYAQARAVQIDRRARLEELAAQMDTLLAGEAPAVAEVATLEESIEAAELQSELAAERVGELRRAVHERLRRLELLEGDLEVLARARPTVESPIGGVWRVAYDPGDRTGTFDLDVDGTLVRGTYRLADGRNGSIRGSYAGLALRLELLESTRGFDAVFTGHYDPSARTLSGLWQATELGAGEPGGGAWTAVRPPADEEPEVEATAEEGATSR